MLLDAHMPGMGGCQAIEQMKRHRATPIPAILMVAASSDGSNQACSPELQVNAYVAKPVKPSELLDAILTVISKPSDRSARDLWTRCCGNGGRASSGCNL